MSRYRLKQCHHCGGDLVWDEEDWLCIQCARYYYAGGIALLPNRSLPTLDWDLGEDNVLLALDPGLRETGWAIFLSGTVAVTGEIRIPGRRVDPQVRLDQLTEHLDLIMAEWHPGAVTHSQPSGINWSVPALDLLAETLTQWSRRHGVSLYGYPTQEVRSNLTGHPNVSKSQLSYAVMAILGMVGHYKTDQEWEAIGVGHYHLSRSIRERELDTIFNVPDGLVGAGGEPHLPDTGCSVAPSCLACPLPQCKFDDAGWLRKSQRMTADLEIWRAVHEEGLTRGEAAVRFSTKVRTIFRALARFQKTKGSVTVSIPLELVPAKRHRAEDVVAVGRVTPLSLAHTVLVPAGATPGRGVLWGSLSGQILFNPVRGRRSAA